MVASRRVKTRIWLKKHLADPYVQQARKAGYRSRAAFKLLQIQEKYAILSTGIVVLDLGASPGSWSQVASQYIGRAGRVIALDRLEMLNLPGIDFIQGDLNDESTQAKLQDTLKDRLADLVLSDMAPDTIGVQMVDQYRSVHLAELVLDLVAQILKPNGTLLIKVFQGVGFLELRNRMRNQFKKLILCKPSASKERSKEVYLLATGLL